MHDKLTAQKPTHVLTEVIWEEQRKGRPCWEDMQLCLRCGRGRSCEEEVEDVLPIIMNSQSERCYFNHP